MKKIYCFLFMLASLITINAHATIDTIAATNFQFTPANVNVNVGDTIHFTFAGDHNCTTNGVPGGLPGGANPVYSGSPGTMASYDYIVTVPGVYEYVCQVHGDAATYSGMKGAFTASAIVPVVLKDFTVSAISKKPLLQWVTETELNAAYFSVKRSTDDIHFTEIAKINAIGNSSTEQSYGFTDNTITGGSNFIYYELVIVDKNGMQKLSNIILFRNTLASLKLIKSISPNPISSMGQLMVYFNADKAGAMKVQVFNAEGKQVLNTNMSAVSGLNSGHIHVCGFEAGTYNIVFSMNGLKETKRVVVN